jgi:hypothetical protein
MILKSEVIGDLIKITHIILVTRVKRIKNIIYCLLVNLLINHTMGLAISISRAAIIANPAMTKGIFKNIIIFKVLTEILKKPNITNSKNKLTKKIIMLPSALKNLFSLKKIIINPHFLF